MSDVKTVIEAMADEDIFETGKVLGEAVFSRSRRGCIMKRG